LRLMPEIVDVKEESVFIVKLLPSAVKLEADMVRQVSGLYGKVAE
jgi:hypothetical protein